jgi:hypothetical protein
MLRSEKLDAESRVKSAEYEALLKTILAQITKTDLRNEKEEKKQNSNKRKIDQVDLMIINPKGR